MAGMYTQHAINRVRAYWLSTGLDRREIAKKAKVSDGTAWMLLANPNWRPNSNTLLKLEALVPDDFMPFDARVAQ